MFSSFLLFAISAFLVSGPSNKIYYSSNGKASFSFFFFFSRNRVDAFQFQFEFQFPTHRRRRRRKNLPGSTAASPRLHPFGSARSVSSEPSKPIHGESTSLYGSAAAKDRDEDLALTIETIMQFVVGSDTISSRSSRSRSSIQEDSTKDQEQNDPTVSLPVDHRMNSKYEELALLVKHEVEKQQQQLQRLGQQSDETGTNANTNTNTNTNGEEEQIPTPTATTWWCAIAGGPGSGKSTLARKVSEICNERFGIRSIVVPMDGYLYSRSDLRSKLGLDPKGCIDYLRRRGSPHTIDAERLCQDLVRASGKQPTNDPYTHGTFGSDTNENESETNNKSSAAFAFPDYRRTAPSDPLAEEIHYDPSHHTVVFVEGEYLLLGKSGMVPGYVTETESKRWKPLPEVFDSAWFVTCQQPQKQQQGDENAAAEARGWYDYEFEEQRKRRMLYHLQEDEDDEETKMAIFPSFSSSNDVLSREEVASKRVDSNDVLNMLVAETSKQHASLVIQSV